MGTSDAEKSTEQLQQEARQQAWVASRTRDPAKRAHAHGRLDEIDEALQDRDR